MNNKLETWKFKVMPYGKGEKKNYEKYYKKLSELYGPRPEFDPNTRSYAEVENFYDTDQGKATAKQIPWHEIDKRNL